MVKLLEAHSDVTVQWASDVAFDGIRLEVASSSREIEFDVSVPDGAITVNTFSKEAPADLILKAIELAQRRRDGTAA